jgi:hypothetical protein
MQKKYKVIAKVDSDKFVKYNVNNLVKFAEFLDINFQGWRWFNVFEYTKDGTGKQITSFTNKNRPDSRYVRFL